MQRPALMPEITPGSSGCGHWNPPKVAFCGECGASLSPKQVPCATCGRPTPARFKFCRTCDAEQSTTARMPALRSSLIAPRFPSHHPSPESSVQHLVISSQQSVVSREEESQNAKVKTQKSKVSDFLLTPNPQPPIPVLVGRDAELTHLYRLLDKALNGERQMVFVTGEAGIGKTALIDAFLAQIRDRADVRITSGQCVEQYGPGEAYMPLLEATTRLCRGPGREHRIEGLKRYAPSWLAQLPGLLDSEDRTLLQQRAQGAKRERMLREMAEAAELFTTTRALVLVLEDLHWSDVSTLDWLSYMARRREPAKLLILGT